jgi:glycerophosphoryl diester phosphodiesterase
MIFASSPTIIGHRGSGSGSNRVTGTSVTGRTAEASLVAGLGAGQSTRAGAPAGIVPPAVDVVDGAPPADHGTTGHSGTAADADSLVENTITSMLAAVRAGISWVEIDVQRTADDELVLRHDPVTVGGDFVIEQTADACGLPRLKDVFEALPTSVCVDVDVKTILEDAVDTPARRTGALLLPVLAAEARRRRLLVTSFDPAVLLQLQQELPDVPLGLLTWLGFPMWHGLAAAAGLGLQAIGLHTGSFRFEQAVTGPGPDGQGAATAPRRRHRPVRHSVEIAHRSGLEVLAWCPKPEDVSAYVHAGVDALVVDDVPGTLAVL